MCSRPTNSASPSLVKGPPLVAQSWLTIQEVAEILNISRDTVERWINTGTLKAVDMSAKKTSRRTWRVSASTLEGFLETRANVMPIPKRATPRRKKSDVVEFIK